MSILTLQSVRKDFGIKEILKDANFSLDTADKVGIIGTNGSGKSTFLKMLAGLEPIDGGQLSVDSGARITYLPQEPNLDENHTVLEQIFADSGEKMALVREYEDLSNRLAHGHHNDSQSMARLSVITQQMDAIGAWDLETQAKIILTKLGIEDFDAPIQTLSGGYRKRIALAAALLAEPDALLMDEPTNHLDAEAVEWLQDYLKGYRGALLLITHDRYFLDRVTNRILEIDRGDLTSYSGNYAYYLEQKTQSEAVEVGRQRKHLNLLRRELEWLKRGPKARSTKQKARIDRAEALQEQEFKQALGRVEISAPSRRLGKKVIELTGISKGYGDRTLIRDFTHTFGPEDRIGIIGSNGTGKSTLMNIITGRIEPDAGSVDIGSTVHIGYFDQHSEDLVTGANAEQRVLDYLKEVAEYVQTGDGTRITASQMLERFLFPPNQQYLPLHKLSGGERRRLFLLKVLMEAPNVLILDEPTNDLDVQTLGVLEEYLEDFGGCVITVSHDRYFLDRTVETIFALEEGGKVRQYPGNYSVYQEIKQAELAAAEQAAPVKQTASEPETGAIARSSSHRRKFSNREREEFQRLEKEIPAMESEKAALEKQIYSALPGSVSEVQKLYERIEALTQAIDAGTERWLELSEMAN